MNKSFFDVVKEEIALLPAELFDELVLNDRDAVLVSGETRLCFFCPNDKIHITVQHKNLKTELADFPEDNGDTDVACRIRDGFAETSEEIKAYLQAVRSEIIRILTLSREDERLFYQTVYRLFWKKVDKSNIGF